MAVTYSALLAVMYNNNLANWSTGSIDLCILFDILQLNIFVWKLAFILKKHDETAIKQFVEVSNFPDSFCLQTVAHVFDNIVSSLFDI